MILTITCNPAIDKTCNSSGLMIGQVNRMNDSINIAGGKGINVTKVLAQFGADVIATGFVGGYTGEYIENAVNEMGIKTEFIPIQNMTRTNTNVIGEDGYVTEILEPGPHVNRFEADQLLDMCKKLAKDCDMVAISGSLPEGISADYYNKLITVCNDVGAKVFFDSSKEALKKGVEAVPYCIKPNKKELEYLVGRKLVTEADVIQAAYTYVRAGVKKVIVSLGEKGLLEISKTKVIKAVPPKIKAVNTVGSGDSVVAAVMLGMSQGMEESDIMKFAAGVSAANATTLESGVIPQDTLDQIVQEVMVVTM